MYIKSGNSQSAYRNADEYNEKYMYHIMDQIYRALGFEVERVQDVEKQYKGADVILRKRGLEIVADEKCDNTRPLYVYNGAREPYGAPRDMACTFAMELSRRQRNHVVANGWFHPSEREKALNSHYIFIWTNNKKDVNNRAGKLTQVSQVEVCIISYDAVKRIVEGSTGFDYDNEIKAVYNAVANTPEDLVRFEQRGNIRMVYSGFLFERPINCVVRKNALREHAFMDFAFNITGDNGSEKIVSVKRLHFDEQHPRNIYDKGFVSLQGAEISGS